jgi:hypothetical protein
MWRRGSLAMKLLGHPELAGHEVEIDYFPLISMPVYPLSEGDSDALGNAIDSGMGLSITIDKLRVFINKTLSILSAYQ